MKRVESLTKLCESLTRTAVSSDRSELDLRVKGVGSSIFQCVAWVMMRGTKPTNMKDVQKWCCESFSEEELETEIPQLKLSLLEAHVRRLCGNLDKIEEQLESKGIQITSCPGICSLNLSSNDLRVESVADAYRAALLFAALRRNEYCIALNMSSNPLGPVSGIVFGSFLKDNKNLHTLNLSRVNLGDEGARMLVRCGLKQNRALRHLNLDANKISCQGTSEIADALRECKLDELRMACNSIGPKGLHVLAKALLSTNSTLKSLVLDGNDVTGCKTMTNLSFRDVTGLHALFAAATASRLCDISLRGCHMDEDQCLGSIVRFLRPGGNAIQKLDLSQNELITDKGKSIVKSIQGPGREFIC